ncbi:MULTISPECIES: hypothetical protein [Bacillaceae]|uniref:Uncharacterized protein n=1 Tax=Evansella alkalicola TaxID=745819 RepID=A0ABS6JNG6_9BACI|nr:MULTISPECIES: hypothetical protein [Bacillaceae]MBU9720107.1 hypothetical protein [Bacillus alkalicola]
MATTTRGKVLRSIEGRTRGQCPVCERTGIKLLYELTNKEGETMQVCKYCRPKKELKKRK